jgi:hypothetical protein
VQPERLPDLVNTNSKLVHRGRRLTATMLLDLGEATYLVHIAEGHITSVEPTPTVMPVWTFALRASRAEWEKFCAAHPLPGSHDIMALMRRRVMSAEGNLHPFITHLQYIKDVLATLRTEEVTQ